LEGSIFDLSNQFSVRRTNMKKLVLAAGAVIASTGNAFAAECNDVFGQVQCVSVPEISALEGTAALAVVAGIVLLAWERRRRAM
jgi:hypothetical protein